MKNYWLYLDSSTFVFKGKQGYLFFNSMSNKNFLVNSDGNIDIIIDQLLEPKQMYCIEISHEQIEKLQLWDFIKKLRETFTGDLFNVEMISKKPIALSPKLSIMKSVDRLKVHPEKSIGQNILNYIHELNIYITGDCLLNCKLCNKYEKQVNTCIRRSEELKFIFIEELINNNNLQSLNKINIFGGDIFCYSHWEDLCVLINNTSVEIKFFNHFLNIKNNLQKIQNIPRNNTISIIIPESFSVRELAELRDLLVLNNINFELNFQITSYLQYSCALRFCEDNYIEHYTIVPIYIGSNFDFFQHNVFLDPDTIFSIPTSKKDIFSHMSINTNDFGRLTFLSNGDVYTNLNFPKIGSIYESSIYELIYFEVLNGKSWFRKRNEEPCRNCVYQWICPSPSNYEIAIGKPNLCHVN